MFNCSYSHWKQKSQVRYWVVSYIISFFFNLAQENLLRVKKISKCCENGITCLRKGKFVGSKASLCIQQRLIMYLTRPGIRMSHTEVLHGRSNRLFFLLEKNFLSCAKYFHYFYSFFSSKDYSGRRD